MKDITFVGSIVVRVYSLACVTKTRTPKYVFFKVPSYHRKCVSPFNTITSASKLH